MSTAHDLSLVHLVQEPRVPSAQPPLLILLHGVGSNERDLFGLAPYLDGRFLTLSVRASYERAPDSHAWFSVQFTAGGPVHEPSQAEESRALLVRFIAEAVAAYGADPARVYLMGFSQGAIMSAFVALTRPDLLAGAVLMSGRTLPEAAENHADDAALAGLPVLIVHGTADTVLPIHHGRNSRNIFAALPVALTYREYPMPHTIGDQSLTEIAAWLTARLDEPAPHAP